MNKTKIIRFFSLVIVAIMLFSCTAVFASAADKCNENIGDVSGDGKVSVSDVSHMLKYIAKWDVNMDTEMADVINDDKVNLSDVSHMLKYIAKWNNIKLGHNFEVGLTADATCKKEGMKHYFCSLCDDNYIETIPVTGKHTYSGGKCTVCGAADPNYTVSGASILDYTIWLAGNGKMDSSGNFYDSMIVEDYYISNSYLVSKNILRIGIMSIGDTAATLAAFVEIPIFAPTGDITFVYTMSGNDVNYVTADKAMTAAEFSQCGDKIEFDRFVSDIYNTCPESDKTLAKTAMDVALLYGQNIINRSGTGFTLGSIGF